MGSLSEQSDSLLSCWTPSVTFIVYAFIRYTNLVWLTTRDHCFALKRKPDIAHKTGVHKVEGHLTNFFIRATESIMLVSLHHQVSNSILHLLKVNLILQRFNPDIYISCGWTLDEKSSNLWKSDILLLSKEGNIFLQRAIYCSFQPAFDGCRAVVYALWFMLWQKTQYDGCVIIM